ncbi:unnamed protein product [Nezara viridula]|uniref:Uncharacterized protein n=1 Tax=Nezara viridula TaxID=85310 RepID=A0A9P0E4R2_NEZVI|nr:unnamed protein product [Nezara viridula]
MHSLHYSDSTLTPLLLLLYSSHSEQNSLHSAVSHFSLLSLSQLDLSLYLSISSSHLYQYHLSLTTSLPLTSPSSYPQSHHTLNHHPLAHTHTHATPLHSLLPLYRPHYSTPHVNTTHTKSTPLPHNSHPPTHSATHRTSAPLHTHSLTPTGTHQHTSDFIPHNPTELAQHKTFLLTIINTSHIPTPNTTNSHLNNTTHSHSHSQKHHHHYGHVSLHLNIHHSHTHFILQHPPCTRPTHASHSPSHSPSLHPLTHSTPHKLLTQYYISHTHTTSSLFHYPYNPTHDLSLSLSLLGSLTHSLLHRHHSFGSTPTRLFPHHSPPSSLTLHSTTVQHTFLSTHTHPLHTHRHPHHPRPPPYLSHLTDSHRSHQH